MTTFQLEQLDYQRHAIDAVVGAFEGQTPNTFDNSYCTEIQANVSDLSPEQFAENIVAAAATNGLALTDAHLSPVDQHGFTKFIILASSVAIREGVMSTLKTFGPQLEALYAKEASLAMQFDADLLLEEGLLKQGFGFARTVDRLETEFPKNTVYQVRDGDRSALVCLDGQLSYETVDALQKRKPDQRFVCLERAFDTTRKWTLTQHLGQLPTAL